MVYEWVVLKNMENEKRIVFNMVYKWVTMKNNEMRKSHCRRRYMCDLQWKHGKREKHTVEHGLWVSIKN
jgi:hypothetical protein